METFRNKVVVSHESVSDRVFVFSTYSIFDRNSNSRIPSEDHLASVMIVPTADFSKVEFRRAVILTGRGDLFDFPGTRLSVNVSAMVKGHLSCTVNGSVFRPKPNVCTNTAGERLIHLFTVPLVVSDFAKDCDWMGLKIATDAEIKKVKNDLRLKKENESSGKNEKTSNARAGNSARNASDSKGSRGSLNQDAIEKMVINALQTLTNKSPQLAVPSGSRDESYEKPRIEKQLVKPKVGMDVDTLIKMRAKPKRTVVKSENAVPRNSVLFDSRNGGALVPVNSDEDDEERDVRVPSGRSKIALGTQSTLLESSPMHSNHGGSADDVFGLMVGDTEKTSE